ncbi:ornithine cyclodeaminase family protein [Mesorhizobium caraganae]|uniref:ornithine cyclodeaminase family protein n=1 Tax=Mesorhizobium caraganae TaxID=483206 RepID=UPI00193A101B|nr:ornithine cyclodeaminase family protein [Mesorhizobium caraganae]MBM2712913.1 ornithine cyclodeaminase family protein [Mesorhizobium caraganae]
MIQLSRSEIQALVSIDSGAIEAIRDAYVAVTDGRGNVPPVGYLGFPDSNGDCHIKYGYITGDPVFVVKIAAGFYDNPAKGLPSSNGIIVAISATTGQIVATLNDEGWLTDLRTGIGGAVATFAVCREDADQFLIVGTGTQARFQARAIASLASRPITISVWGRSRAKAEELKANLKEYGADVAVVDDLEVASRVADVIVTTTPSSQPLIMSDWVRAGTHLTAMGADSPGKQELDRKLVARANCLVVDIARQCLEHGEFAGAFADGLIKADDCTPLGAILSGKVVARRNPTDITIADLTGVATQDIAIARTVLERIPGLKL